MSSSSDAVDVVRGDVTEGVGPVSALQIGVDVLTLAVEVVDGVVDAVVGGIEVVVAIIVIAVQGNIVTINEEAVEDHVVASGDDDEGGAGSLGHGDGGLADGLTIIVDIVIILVGADDVDTGIGQVLARTNDGTNHGEVRVIAAGDHQVVMGRILDKNIHVVGPELAAPRSADSAAVVVVVDTHGLTLSVGAKVVDKRGGGGGGGEDAAGGQLIADTIGSVGQKLGLGGIENVDRLILVINGLHDAGGVLVVDSATIELVGDLVDTIVKLSEIESFLVSIIDIDIGDGFDTGTIEVVLRMFRAGDDFHTAEHPRLAVGGGNHVAGGVADIYAVAVLVPVTILGDVLTVLGITVVVGVTGSDDAVVVTPAVTSDGLVIFGGVANNTIGDGIPCHGEVAVGSGGDGNAVTAKPAGGHTGIAEVGIVDAVHVVAAAIGTRGIVEIVEVVLQRVGVEETLLVEIERSGDTGIAGSDVGEAGGGEFDAGIVVGDTRGVKGYAGDVVVAGIVDISPPREGELHTLGDSAIGAAGPILRTTGPTVVAAGNKGHIVEAPEIAVSIGADAAQIAEADGEGGLGTEFEGHDVAAVDARVFVDFGIDAINVDFAGLPVAVDLIVDEGLVVEFAVDLGESHVDNPVGGILLHIGELHEGVGELHGAGGGTCSGDIVAKVDEGHQHETAILAEIVLKVVADTVPAATEIRIGHGKGGTFEVVGVLDPLETGTGISVAVGGQGDAVDDIVVADKTVVAIEDTAHGSDIGKVEESEGVACFLGEDTGLVVSFFHGKILHVDGEHLVAALGLLGLGIVVGLGKGKAAAHCQTDKQ